MKKIPKLLIATSVALSVTAGGVVSATAAPLPTVAVAANAVTPTIPFFAPEPKKAKTKVSITTKSKATVSSKSAKYKLKPAYKKAKGVTVTSSRLEVKKSNGKRIVKSASSVKLAQGSYKVKTTVKYKYKLRGKSVYKTASKNSSFKVYVKAPAPKITINTRKNVTVDSGKKYTVRPSFDKSGKLTVTSSYVSATKNGRSVAGNKNSIALDAGTYRVKTTVKYYYKNGKKKVYKTSVKTQTFVVTSRKPVVVKPTPKPPVNSDLTGSYTDDANEMFKVINDMRAKNGQSNLKRLDAMDKATLAHAKSYNKSSMAPTYTLPVTLLSYSAGYSGYYVGYTHADLMKMWGADFKESVNSKQYTHVSVSTHVGNGRTYMSVLFGDVWE